MVKGIFAVLLILSILLISSVYADKISMSPITGKDIVSSTADQPGVSITEGSPVSQTNNSPVQNFIKNDLIYLIGGVILIVIIALLIIVIKKIRKTNIETI